MNYRVLCNTQKYHNQTYNTRELRELHVREYFASLLTMSHTKKYNLDSNTTHTHTQPKHFIKQHLFFLSYFILFHLFFFVFFAGKYLLE